MDRLPDCRIRRRMFADLDCSDSKGADRLAAIGDKEKGLRSWSAMTRARISCPSGEDSGEIPDRQTLNSLKGELFRPFSCTQLACPTPLPCPLASTSGYWTSVGHGVKKPYFIGFF